jgi:hypothetical protein
MLPLRERQCVILVNGDALPVVSGAVWLDSLYFRWAENNEGSFAETSKPLHHHQASPSIIHAHGGRLWITSSVIQGDGSTGAGALLLLNGAKALLAGVRSLCTGRAPRPQGSER